MPNKKNQPKNQDIVKAITDNAYYRERLVYNEENDSFLWYNDDNNYSYMDDKDFTVFLHDFITEFFPEINVSLHLAKEIRHLLKAVIPRSIIEEDKEYIAFNDKLFNLSTFEPEEKDRNIVTTFCLPFNYEDIIQGKFDEFDKFLKSIFVYKDRNSEWQTDYDLLELVQEMCGSFLVPDMECSQAWFWVGDGGNGKTVLAKVVQNIFPKKLQTSLTLQKLTTNNFALSHLVGKRININAEEESRYIDTSTFKALIFGDQVHAERKFGDTFEFVPQSKFVFLTNNMPSLGSVDTGIRRRIQIIPFKRNLTKQEQDPYLFSKLKKELPGIIYWMLDGARKITEKNYKFSEPRVAVEAVEDFVKESSSSIEFITENYTYDLEGKISQNELYEHYCEWCRQSGRRPLSRSNFVKDVKREMKIESKACKIDNRTIRVLPLKLYDNQEEEQNPELNL